MGPGEGPLNETIADVRRRPSQLVYGRVGVWRSCARPNISVVTALVWRCPLTRITRYEPGALLKRESGYSRAYHASGSTSCGPMRIRSSTLRLQPVHSDTGADDTGKAALLKWDYEFESLFLQRGVCEPSVPQRRPSVPPEERIDTFDQDGTLWVEHPIYTQVVYCL